MQQYSAPVGSQADGVQWDQSANNMGYSGSAPGYNNMNGYGSNGAISQPMYDQSTGAPSTQLARRPMNRQLQRMPNDSNDQYDRFRDNSMLDSQGTNGLMEENDNIELLEERATAAKRDAQSKRKQIPPFVQKLSR